MIWGGNGQLLERHDQQKIRCLGERGVVRTNRTAEEWHNWCLARERIDKERKEYYRACTTQELPPQLLALSKKLDEELLKKREVIAPIA
jgi:hypothetical protein